MADAQTPPTPAQPLPEIRTELAEAQVLERLETAARRGRLPGFLRMPGSTAGGFVADAFGTPYDGELRGEVSRSGSQTVVRFSTRLKPKMPAIFLAILIVTVWPGVVLTESMLASLLPGWGWLWRTTWYWYLPLTVPFVPWLMWSTLKRSRAAVHASALEQVGKIATELGAASAAPTPANAKGP